jgi:drug/metabolite transporter (DMT)-like permease
MAEAWAVFLVLLAAFVGAFGSIYLKKASHRLEFSIRGLIGNSDLIKGAVFYGSSTVIYVIGIKGGELSVLFPLVSTGYIWVCFLSRRYLGERMTRLRWAGIGCIVVGVTLIGLGS